MSTTTQLHPSFPLRAGDKCPGLSTSPGAGVPWGWGYQGFSHGSIQGGFWGCPLCSCPCWALPCTQAPICVGVRSTVYVTWELGAGGTRPFKGLPGALLSQHLYRWCWSLWPPAPGQSRGNGGLDSWVLLRQPSPPQGGRPLGAPCPALLSCGLHTARLVSHSLTVF